ncbi:retrotransposon ty1-copia subclass [Moniliophthora roreri MCA 2997]|uniref:Retrotransposon ty1-copia subclass n=1 Tax=Moniliophthora roreri (strain MCA 2997) TaxID=1381753 RepID=V2XRK0_MONRO|nr:retrotransposon ty1-copia subclass [Moniliophthora roreri MCA 2997]
MLEAALEEGLYVITGVPAAAVHSAMAAHTLPNDPQYLHQAAAHIMPEQLELGVKVLDGMLEIEPGLRERLSTCQDCREGNTNMQLRPERPDMVTESNFWWFIDLWGPSRVISIGRNLYGLFGVDKFTGRKFFEALKNRQAATVLDKLEPLRIQSETQTGNKLKRIRSDNTPELHSDLTKSWFQKHGIIHEFTVPYSLASNGAGERTIGVVLQSVQSMLVDSQLSAKWWAHAMATATHTINLFPLA